MNQMRTFLLIGTGSIGRRHLRNTRALRSDASWWFLRRDGHEDDLSRETGARVFRELGDLPAPPTAAIIASPTSEHARVLPMLLAQGIPCYVEKPVVARRDELDETRRVLAGLARPPVTQTGCNLRWLPALRRLRRALPEAGTLVRAQLEAGQWLPDWRPQSDYRTGYSARRELGGGVLLDLIHEIDAARWLFGDFDRVRCLAGTFSGLEIDTEDTALVLLGRAGGPLVSVSLDYVARRPVRRYEIVGTAGTLVWDGPGRTLWLDTASGRTVLADRPDDFDVGRTYVTAMEEFLTAVDGQSDTSQPLTEGLASLDLALRAREHALLP